MSRGLRLLLYDLIASLILLLSDFIGLLSRLVGWMRGDMIFSLRGQVIGSDKGFSVELIDRAGLIYSEGKKRVVITAEMLGPDSPYFMWVAKSSMRRWGKYRLGRIISAAEKDEVINNIRELFRSKGLEIDVLELDVYETEIDGTG